MRIDGTIRTATMLAAAFSVAMGGVSRAADETGETVAVDFVADVQPIFAAHCVECHGAEKQRGGLRLDHGVSALRGGDHGAVIKPGDPAGSRLIQLVRGDDPKLVMPAEGDRLTKQQIQTLERWVAAGADWPAGADGEQPRAQSDHWAFQPIVRPDPPAVRDEAWVRNEIDRFVLARLESRGLAPSPAADRYTLIKRLYYDLLGLPPTPAAVDAFVNDASPKAYENLVDRLLASPRFGERWGRHWLDKARYADSDGYEKDRPRPNAWRYRDWVINAINDDMPFDQFTIEQLAGDLLPGARPEQRLATAFHRQTLTNTEGGTDQEEFRVAAVVDRVNTTGTVWLGLTVGCAQCHTHKYDPVTQREYYRLFAFFNNGDETNTKVPISDEAVRRHEREKAVHDKKVAELRAKLDARRREVAQHVPAQVEQLKARLEAEEVDTIHFHELEVVELKSVSGAAFERQEDGSYLVTGDRPDKDAYTIQMKTELRGITGLRLQTLADDRLPSKGPGRTGHGNFVLTHIRAFAAGQTPVKPEHAIAFEGARADFAQDNFEPAKALDQSALNGWAISPKMGASHEAVFTFEKPVDIEGATFLQVVLDQQYGGQHTIGRFRVTAMTGRQPGLDVPEPVRAALAAYPGEPGQHDEKQAGVLTDYFASQDEAYGKLNEQMAALQKKAPASPMMDVRVIAQRGSPRTTRILRRGDFLDPGDEVTAGALEVLHEYEAGGQRPAAEQGGDRLDLARWLVDPQNPLTPRVTVNQWWHHLFGEALVRTVNDFGVRGERPTHPQLLDWLADALLQRGWSRKQMIKLIVMSATYRQASRHRPTLAEIDPENRLLHRQNRFRVEGEIVRDLSLAVGGLLSEKIGGPSVFPPLPPGVAELSYANNFKWKTSEGEDRYRRGMYTFFKRTAPDPMLITFDCPDSNTTSVDRTLSNTPLQALTTLNNEVFVEASRALGRRLLLDGPGEDRARIAHGFRLCAARPPSAKQVERFVDLLNASRAYYRGHAEDAKRLIGDYQTQGVAAEEAAAWVVVARVMMNMDSFLTRE